MLRGAQHDKTGEGSCRGAEKQRAGSPIHETSCSSWLNDRGFKFSGLRFRLARSARERAEDLVGFERAEALGDILAERVEVRADQGAHALALEVTVVLEVLGQALAQLHDVLRRGVGVSRHAGESDAAGRGAA